MSADPNCNDDDSFIRPAWLSPLADPRNEAILGAAFELFCERGFHGVTMLEIATRAKVSKETLYDRFDSKEGLFYALLAWGGRMTALDPAGYADDLETPPHIMLERLAYACMIKLYSIESIEVARIAYTEARRNPEIGREFDLAVNLALLDSLKAIAVRLEEAAAAAIPDQEEFADVFVGLMKGQLHQSVLLGSRTPPSEADIAVRAERLTRRFLKAFAR